MKRRQGGFTIAELLVAVVILSMLVLLMSRLFGSAADIASTASKRMDVDSQLRPVFSRMAADVAKMVRRSDIAAYAKVQPPDEQQGNDLIAFYSLVDGFFPSTTTTAEKHQPQTTLVAYRINQSHQLERMAKGLAFAGQHTSTPLLFGTANAIGANWPSATSATATDQDYSVVAPAIFRFEYYYIMKNNGATSKAPWASVAQINLTDIAAIAVDVAAIDSRSRVLLTDNQVTTLAGMLEDYDPAMKSDGLLTSWQSAINNDTTLPRAAMSNVRCFQRIFGL